jgi:hypothetical protein
MKSQFSFTVKNVSVPAAEVNIGEFTVSAEVEYTPEEFLALVSQAGVFYAWLAEKVEPIIEAATTKGVAAMQRDAKDEEPSAMSVDLHDEPHFAEWMEDPHDDSYAMFLARKGYC